MNQAVSERGTGPGKPRFDGARPNLDFSRNTETTPRAEGIYVSIAALTTQIENGAKAVGGETPAQLALKTWLAELVQKNYLPYLRPQTTDGSEIVGALALRVHQIDKTAGLVYAKPNLLQSLLGQDGNSSRGKTSVIGGQWQTNDVLIALRLPLAETNKSNQVGLVQAGIFRQEEGDKWWRMLKAGPHTQNLAALINLLFGLGSFGIGSDKTKMSDTALIELPGGFPSQRLAHADLLQILPNHDFNGEIPARSKPHQLIKLAKF